MWCPKDLFFFWEEITENERLQKNYQVILVTLWLCLKLSTGTNIKVYQRKGSKDILDTVTLMVELKSSLEQIAQWSYVLGKGPKCRCFKPCCGHLMFCVVLILNKILYLHCFSSPSWKGYWHMLGVNQGWTGISSRRGQWL